MKEFDIEERVKLAVQNFESGFNCAQSVFLAYSDVFELNLDMAKQMSVSFGGGVGRKSAERSVLWLCLLDSNIRYWIKMIRKPGQRIMEWCKKWLNCLRNSMVRLSAGVFCLPQKPARQLLPLLQEQRNIMPSALAANMWKRLPG